MSQPPVENHLELESQFILRLPDEPAKELRDSLRSGVSLGNRLSIQLNNDMRHGCVQFDQYTLSARLLDLPTIIESYKTLDRKNLYKTADISQILICKEEPEEPIQNENQDLNARNNKREFSFPHGITPPLKNVRKKRFRKTMKKKFVDVTEIEKEVRRLFQFDCRAINVRYEVIEESKIDSQPATFDLTNAASPMSAATPGLHSADNSQNLDLVHDLFGGECSSSDESDDDDDDDDKDDDVVGDFEADATADAEADGDIDSDSSNINDENDDDDDDDDDIDAMVNELSQPASTDIAAEEAAASDLIAQNEDNEEKKQELMKELSKIRERIQNQEAEMNGLDNLALRQRLQSVLDSLYEQEREVNNQIEDLNRYR